MATDEDKFETEQQAMMRLGRGTKKFVDAVGETIATTVVTTYPSDPIDSRNRKRILVRLSHISSEPFTAGKLTVEFSDTEDFTNVTFFETIDLTVATNPLMTKVAATIGADTEHHIADLDVESMDDYCRVKVRNDSVATITYDIAISSKVN
ncbi:MAG: hypothetical protein ACTSVR_04680 [Candidatus Thorarchaeota archaeon]